MSDDRTDSPPEEHRPKTAALVAYAEGLLSPDGLRRVEAHLSGCARCRQELAAIRLYDGLIEDVQEAPAPAVDFERMELALAREARVVAADVKATRRLQSWAPWLAVGVAAAALLGLYFAWSSPEIAVAPTNGVTPPAPAPAPVPSSEESRPMWASVTLAAGVVERVTGDAPEPLAYGDVVREGEAIRTGPLGQVHLRLSDGTGLVFAGGGLETSALSERLVALELVEGRVTNRVAPRPHGSSYQVQAADHVVRVVGTHFSVSHHEGLVEVDLAEGSVEITTPDGRSVLLTAPARWSSAGGAGGSNPPELVEPRGLEAEPEDGAPWTPVTLTHPEIVRWQVDGTTLTASGPLRLGLHPGEHTVEGWGAQDRHYLAQLPVGDVPVAMDEGTLVPEAPRVRPGHLEPEEITRVVRRGQRQLERCYERSLTNHSILGHIRLRVTVDHAGEVRRVNVLGLEGAGSAQLRTCMSNYVQRWSFPPPGGPMTFEAPITLAPRQ